MADLPFAMEISGVAAESFEVTDETLQYCEILVRSAGIAESYRIRLKLRLMDYYEKSGDMEKLRAVAGTLRPGDLQTEERNRAIALMSRCGMDQEAADWIVTGGAEGCTAELLSEVALGAAEKARDDDAKEREAGRIAWAAFERGSRQRPVLELILHNYDGLMEDLSRVRDAVMEEAQEDPDDPAFVMAEDRLLSQMLFSGEMGKEQEALLLRQYNRGGAHRTLSAAGIAQYCHYVFAEWRDMDPLIMT